MPEPIRRSLSGVNIWYQSTLDFVHHPNYEKALSAHLRKIASPGTRVLLHGRSGGSAAALTAAEIVASPIVYFSVVDRAFVQFVLDAEEAGADAFVAASFCEPILPELRSLAIVPVVSMTEACFAAAAAMAPKVGFVTLNKHIVPFIEKSIVLHKWRDRISGIHLLEGDTSETELDAKLAEPGPYLERLVAAARTAIAGGAQAVIVAEGILGLMAAENNVREVDGVPLVDSIATPILFAEFIVSLKRRTGIEQSRAAYPLPSKTAREFIEASEFPGA